MEIVDFSHAEHIFSDGVLSSWGKAMLDTTRHQLREKPHGDTQRWLSLLNQLPNICADNICLDCDAVMAASTVSAKTQGSLRETLMGFHPWRKGPFHIHGIDVDTEWRSNLKWDRLVPHIAPLEGRRVLDIGCGNGYYLWRMLGKGARCAVGVDPTRLFAAQFQAVRHFVGPGLPATILPLGIENIPYGPVFDTVFSMGVIYHRRDPLEHIRQLKSLLRPGGELVLETLVIESDDDEVLHPEGRYAQMRNVWNIPSPSILQKWVADCGFNDATISDVTRTTEDEQRATEWMHFQSLSDFLDKNDKSLTIEGYPAPARAMIIATKE